MCLIDYRCKLATAFLLAFTVPGVADAQKKKKEPPPPPTTTMVLQAKLPSMAPLAETPQTQDKGGLRITVSPVSYSDRAIARRADRAANPRFGERLANSMMNKDAPTTTFVERIYHPQLVVVPDQLRFRVHISNQMSRVFRGQGIAVQFNVSGKTQAISQSAYADLVSLIIPPRGEQDVAIFGPRLDTIADPTTVGLFLYDVVTNTDPAGNVTEKQNFEWYFSYRTQIVEREVDVPSAQRLWITGGPTAETMTLPSRPVSGGAPASGGGTTAPATATRFVSRDNPKDTLDLREDQSFRLSQKGRQFAGQYEWSGDTLTLIMGKQRVRAKVAGEVLTDDEGKLWTRSGNENIASVATAAVAQPEPKRELLSNADIVKLVQAKLPESVVLGRIKNSDCRFDVSTEALVKLKEANVSDAVIQAMTEAPQK